MKKTIIVLIAMSAVVAAVQADVINVNFIRHTGSNVSMDGTAYGANISPFAYSGSTWHDIAGASGGSLGAATDMANSEGTPTTVDFDLTMVSPGGGPTWQFSSSLGMVANYATRNNMTSGALTLSGLVANTDYNIAIISQGDANGQGVSASIGGGAIQTSAGSDITASSYIEGVNFLQFTSVTADPTGTIVVDLTNAAGSTWTPINGFQIDGAMVPEPATLGLVATFGGAVIFIRRRMTI